MIMSKQINQIPITVLNVGDVKVWEDNARIHTKRNFDELKKSLVNWGQTKPILVQKSTMRIIAGNGTYQAILALGWDKVNCHVMDIDDVSAEALAIADNRIGLLSQWDDRVLTQSLKHLQEEGSLDLTGFDNMELEKMMSFQDGSLFEKVDAGKQSQKDNPPLKKEEPLKPKQTEPEELDTPPSGIKDDAPYTEQISFVLDGFVFTLSRPQPIKELHELMRYLKDAKKPDREEVTEMVFDKILDVLYNKFMSAEDEK